jgi:hypothetical protein
MDFHSAVDLVDIIVTGVVSLIHFRADEEKGRSVLSWRSPPHISFKIVEVRNCGKAASGIVNLIGLAGIRYQINEGSGS